MHWTAWCIEAKTQQLVSFILHRHALETLTSQVQARDIDAEGYIRDHAMQRIAMLQAKQATLHRKPELQA